MDGPARDEDDPEDDRWVTVARCPTAIAADFVRSLLDQGGVESLLQDQYLNQVFAFLVGPLGGIKVQVRRRDLPAAIEILRRPPQPLAPDQEPPEGAVEPAFQCPRCGSEEATFVPAAPEGFVLVLLEKLIPLPFLHGHWVCEVCGKRWLEVTSPRA